MKSTASKTPKGAQVDATTLVPAITTLTATVIDPALTARVNHMALLKGKAHADRWRSSAMAKLQWMVDSGDPLDDLSSVLASIVLEPGATGAAAAIASE